MKKMLLVFNPKAGRGEFIRKLYEVIDLFSRTKYRVEVYPTIARNDAKSYIQEHGSGFDLIVCSGGDGTVNEAVNACMCMKKLPILAYIPSGTTNDFAKTLKLPNNIVKSAQYILNGQPHIIDVGALLSPKQELNVRYFSYVAAFGLFTNVSYITDQKTKNILGRIAYILESIKQLRNIPSIDCIINIDGEIINGKFVLGIITNATSIGGFQFFFEKNVALDDGYFEVVLIRKPKNILERQEIINTLCNSQSNSNLVILRTASRIDFSSTHSCDWTVDGEYGGQHKEITLENQHQALNIVMPNILNP